MKRVFSAAVAIPFCALALLTLSHCASEEVSDNDPAAMMKEAEEDIQADRFQLATDQLRLVKNKHPYSKEAVDAALRLADVAYMQESYAEAAAQYEAFRDLHPKHAKVNYAMYRIGLSHFMDTPSIVARDLTPASKAQEAFQDYLARFPNDEFTADAKAKLLEARKILAEKELYIAKFYDKRDMWDSARARYQKVTSLYPDTPESDVAQKRLKDIEGKKND